VKRASLRAALPRSRALGCALVGLLGAAGCAQSPTELVVFAGADATVPPAITSIQVTVTSADKTTTRVFQSLGAAAPDADIPLFSFPTFLDLQLTRDGISGPVQVDVAASDPTVDDTVLASASIATTLAANKTTKVSVLLTATPSAGAGGAGGGAGGAGGGAGGAGGGAGAAGGASGTAGAGGA